MRKSVPILLVEDDPVDVEAVTRAFRIHNVRNSLHVVGDGLEALAYLRNEGDYSDPAAHPRPGLILMDLRMPRMDGLECMRELERDSDLDLIPVVVFTSSKEEVDIVASFQKGASSYLVKPVSFEKLLEAIRTFDLYWTLSEVP